ncbi:MAG: transcription antitermination factor NusB [Clostridia bacterium]|nr:transcription antitermination factor NusB [Clostridia bacterium]
MTRKEAREQAFIIIFEKEFNNEYSLDEIIEAAKDAELFDADEFAINIAKETLADIENLDSVISSNLKGGWRIGRISKVSLAILRLAICEMTKFNDIPVSVSINEAVELAKKYAAEEDSSFVNGLLSSVNKGLTADV